MKKSRIAILVIAIIVICTTIGVSFAAYNSSQMKDSITIGTGESVGINVDISDRVYFANENGARLVPQGALALKDDNGIFQDSLTKKNNDGVTVTNQIALMGNIKIHVTGALVNKLQFTVKNLMCGNMPAHDYIEVVFLRNYSKFFDKFDFAKKGVLPTDKNAMPYFLGAQWNDTTNNYEGGSKADIQTKSPLGINEKSKPHEFTMIVYFKLDAENMPSGFSNSQISFDLTIEAI